MLHGKVIELLFGSQPIIKDNVLYCYFHLSCTFSIGITHYFTKASIEHHMK